MVRAAARPRRARITQDGSILIATATSSSRPTRRVENLAEARRPSKSTPPAASSCPASSIATPTWSFRRPAPPSRYRRRSPRHPLHHRSAHRAPRPRPSRSHGPPRRHHCRSQNRLRPDPRAELKLSASSLRRTAPIDVVPTFLFRMTARPIPRTHPGPSPSHAHPSPPPPGRLRRCRVGDGANTSPPSSATSMSPRMGFPRKVHAHSPRRRVASAPPSNPSPLPSITSSGPPRRSHPTRRLPAPWPPSCPTLPFRPGGPAPRPARFDRCRRRVALASNFNPLLSPAFNMQTVVALACLRMRMTPAEAISAATINGARPRRGHRTGSLEPGKLAEHPGFSMPPITRRSPAASAQPRPHDIKRGEIIYAKAPSSAAVPPAPYADATDAVSRLFRSL